MLTLLIRGFGDGTPEPPANLVVDNRDATGTANRNKTGTGTANRNASVTGKSSGNATITGRPPD